MRLHTKDFMLPLLACAAIFGCRDLLPSSPAAAATQARMLGDLTCTVTPREHRVVCVPSGSAEPSGARRAILGNGQIRMASTNVAMDTVAHVFQATVTVPNLLTYALGTPDGTTVSGVTVFYSAGPTVTAYVSPGDTGTVTVANAESSGSFTAAHQPYYLYDQILQPSAVSAPKLWKWNWPRTVASFSFQVKVFAAMPGESRVPETAPDTVPAFVYNPQKYVYGSTWQPNPFIRDLLVVAFTSGATREERQAAVDLVSGVVVGGSASPLGEGEYFIRIPDTGNENGIRQALAALSGLPQVEYAVVELVDVIGPMYRRPDDGVFFRPGDWQMNPDSAQGVNWTLEAIDAPEAWGCSIGNPDAPTRVGVVDQHLTVPGDLAPNVGTQFGVGVVTGWGHGTAVASVIGARTNNGSGMPGIAWFARMNLYETGVDPLQHPTTDSTGHSIFTVANVIGRMDRAARDSAAVINVSMGLTWDHVPGSHPGDSLRVQPLLPRFRHFAARLDSAGLHPLIVIAAGNDGVDAYYSGIPNLKRYLPATVVVVGGAHRVSPAVYAVHDSSNRDVPGGTHLLDVMAPADSVPAIVNDGTLRPFYHTSAAAPQVSGIAALLFAFDPRLTASEVKNLIVAGAAAGGRSVGSYRLVDAYESLKLAAQRRGAPVCGNAVWTDGKGVFVQRGGSAIDTLYDDTTSIRPRGVDVLHGGRHIRVNLSPGYQNYSTDLIFRDGRWQHATAPVAGWQPYVDSSGGSYLSGMARPLSHDRDVIAYDIWDKTDGNLLVKVGPTATTNASSPYDLTVQRTMAAAATTSTCTITGLDADTTHFCSGRTLYSPLSEFSGWGVVLLPGGKEVVISFSRLRSEWQPSGWAPCTIDNDQPMLCRTLQGRDWYPESELFIERIADQVVTHHFTIPNVGLRAMRVDETGTHLIAEYHEGYANKVMQSMPGVGYVPVTTGGTAACGFGVYSVTTGSRERTLAGADCMSGYTGLTFSPTRTPLAGAGVHRSSRAASTALFPQMGSVPFIFRSKPLQLQA